MPDTYDTNEDGFLFVPPMGVLLNDLDAEGDTLTAALVSPTTFGSVQLQSDGSFLYTPFPEFSGTDWFSYQASDGTRAATRPWSRSR